MPAMVSLCAFQDKQPIDCMTFLNTSFYGASTGRMTFQSILVGWGRGERFFLTAIVEGLVQVRINCEWSYTKLDICLFSSSHLPFCFVTSHTARVTRVRQSSKKAGFILDRKKASV